MKNLLEPVAKHLFLLANVYFIALLFFALNDIWASGHALDIAETIICTAIILFGINLFFPIKWLRYMLGFLTCIWAIISIFAFISEFDFYFNPHLKSSFFIANGVFFILFNIIFSLIILFRRPQHRFSDNYAFYS